MFIYGKIGKVIKVGEKIGVFYNYCCSYLVNGGSEVLVFFIDINCFFKGYFYYSFCCC